MAASANDKSMFVVMEAEAEEEDEDDEELLVEVEETEEEEEEPSFVAAVCATRLCACFFAMAIRQASAKALYIISSMSVLTLMISVRSI